MAEVTIVGAVLTWARAENALSISSAAKLIGITDSELVALERAPSRPVKLELLRQIAKVYELPVLTLAAKQVPPSAPRPKDFRTVDGKQSKITQKTALAIRQARQYIEAIEELLEEYPERRIPFDDPRLTLSHNAIEGARAARARCPITVSEQLAWRDEAEAFRAWREWVESRGAYVFVLDFPTDDCRGFSLDGETPAIAVGKEDSRAAQAFTLIHEYCHLLLRKPGLSGGLSARNKVERFCNVFAAHFLMSDEAIARTVPATMDKEDAAAVSKSARRMRVSAQALSIRLEELGRIKNGLYRRFSNRRPAHKKPGGDGLPIPPYITTLSALGPHYANDVMTLRARGDLGDVEASRILNLSPHHFRPLQQRLEARGLFHVPVDAVD